LLLSSFSGPPWPRGPTKPSTNFPPASAPWLPNWTGPVNPSPRKFNFSSFFGAYFFLVSKPFMIHSSLVQKTSRHIRGLPLLMNFETSNLVSRIGRHPLPPVLLRPILNHPITPGLATLICPRLSQNGCVNSSPVPSTVPTITPFSSVVVSYLNTPSRNCQRLRPPLLLLHNPPTPFLLRPPLPCPPSSLPSLPVAFLIVLPLPLLVPLRHQGGLAPGPTSSSRSHPPGLCHLRPPCLPAIHPARPPNNQPIDLWLCSLLILLGLPWAGHQMMPTMTLLLSGLQGLVVMLLLVITIVTTPLASTLLSLPFMNIACLLRLWLSRTHPLHPPHLL